MRRDYTFNTQDFLSFIYDSKISHIVKNHENTLKIASKFILSFLSSRNFYLELLNEQLGKIELKASANGKDLFFTLLNEQIVIEYENKQYTFLTDWTDLQYFVKLEMYKVKEKDKTITQSIDAHQIKIEIQVEKRIYSFIIPYDIDYYLDIHSFNMITKDTTILDLKRIYMNRFFKNQSAYEHQCLTYVSIKEITEQGNIILLDELTIKEGFVLKYVLSSINHDVIIRINGIPNEPNEIQILNYQMQSEIDFKNEIKNLYERSRRINIE